MINVGSSQQIPVPENARLMRTAPASQRLLIIETTADKTLTRWKMITEVVLPLQRQMNKYLNVVQLLLTASITLNCKATCDTRNCNKEPSEALGDNRLQCYTCSASRDSAGNSVGVSDDRCFEGLSSDFLQACSADQVCRDDLMADWFPKGDQHFTIIRGCWTPNNPNDLPEPSCIESSSAALNFEFRDCVKYCDESYCNQDMSIGDLHSSPNNIQSCHTCSYNEVGDDREGLPSCLFNSSPNRPKNCPNYANHECF